MKKLIALLVVLFTLNSCELISYYLIDPVHHTNTLEKVVLVDKFDLKEYPQDSFEIDSVLIRGDSLIMSINYSGGCNDHAFKLIAAKIFSESFPVRIAVNLSHAGFDDACDAIISKTLVYDIRPIKRLYQSFYRDNGPVILSLFYGGNDSIYLPEPVYRWR